MYENHWQLTHKPFENTTDLQFYFPAESHQGALLKLQYAIENRRGAALLVGTSGLGKTLLLRALAKQLGEAYSPIAHVVFPQMPADQLLAFICDEITGHASSSTPTIQQSVQRLGKALHEIAEAGRHVVLIIDEAHLIADAESLETLRLLMNFEHAGRPALTLILSGQPAVLPTLDRVPELDERIGVKCLLNKFTLEETRSYIQHRMQLAGSSTPIFEDAAIETIHQLSHGVPRRINRLSDLALLIGFAEEHRTVGAEQIESVASELVAVTTD